MNTNHIIHKARAILCFCLVLTANCSTAQNQENYKYVITLHDIPRSWNTDILEVDNRYYVLSVGQPSSTYPQIISNVTIYDSDLNEIERILLPGQDILFSSLSLFYVNNYFYLFGAALDSNQTYKPCIAKCDKQFNLVQPFSLYALDDTLEYGTNDVIITKENEFIFLTLQIQINLTPPVFNGRIFHINNQGNVLQEVFFLNSFFDQNIVETDSHYFVSTWTSPLLEKFCKDSLNKFDTLSVKKHEREIHEGTMISVGNQLIRSNTVSRKYDECEGMIEGERLIVFLNEDMSIKNHLIVGKRCANDGGGRKNMHYLNSDSIYYAYKTQKDGIGDNISIANFSWDGKLNFDYHLDIAEDSLPYRDIHRCKALSNGGVLISGIAGKSSIATDDSRGFLLLYHPPKNVGIAETDNYPSLRVYPNPTTGQLIIECRDAACHVPTVEIYDIVGQMVMTSPNPSKGGEQAPSLSERAGGEVVLDVSHLASGMYFLKVNNKTIKFVKQ